MGLLELQLQLTVKQVQNILMDIVNNFTCIELNSFIFIIPVQQVTNADRKRCSYLYAQEIGLLKYRSNQVCSSITLIRPQVAICFSSLHCSSPLLLHIFSAVVLNTKHKIFDFLNGPCGKDLHICQSKTFWTKSVSNRA